MKVIVNKPAPVVSPPTTYDLVGLTADEVQAIRNLIGNSGSRDAQAAYDVLRVLRRTDGFGSNTSAPRPIG